VLPRQHERARAAARAVGAAPSARAGGAAAVWVGGLGDVRDAGDEEDGGVMGDAQGGAGAGTAFTAGGKAGGGGTSSPMLILRSTGDSFASGRRRGHASGAGAHHPMFLLAG